MYVGRHAFSKWARLLCACLLAVFGAAGIFRAVRSGLAQERYLRYKYGHMVGTRWEVPPAASTNLVEMYMTLPGKLPEILDACEKAHRLCPENYYFAAFAARQALWVALVVDRDDPVAFRRHFGAAEHWSNVALSLNPYDFENYHLHFRILWEKGDRDEAIAWWRDTVLAREFWNPDLRNHLIDYCMANGDYSIARREAVFLRGGSKELRDFDAARRRRSARSATKGK